MISSSDWCVEVVSGVYPNADAICRILNIPYRQTEYDNRIGDKTIGSRYLKQCILDQKDNFNAGRCNDGYCLNFSNNSTCETLNSTTIPILNTNYTIIGVTGYNNYCLRTRGTVSTEADCFTDFVNVCLDLTKNPLYCWDLDYVSTYYDTMPQVELINNASNKFTQSEF